MEKVAMTVKEMGQQLGISPPKAYELTNIKGFPCIQVGRRKIIPIDAFKRWMNEQASGQAETRHG